MNVDAPGEILRTDLRAIDGSNLVGFYRDLDGKDNGFIYNGTTWTTLNMPGAGATRIFGIDGSHLVGYYSVSGTHGFVYEIPEPATLLLFGLGALMFRKRRA